MCRAVFVILVPCLGLVACDDVAGTDSDSPAQPLTGFTLSVDPILPTVAHAIWDVGPGGDTWLEYGETEEALTWKTPTGTDAAASAVALAEGRTWYFRAVTMDGVGDRWESEVATLDVPYAPSELPRFTVSETSAPDIDPDALVFTSLLQDGTSWLVGMNRDGEYVWWWQSDGDVDIDSVHAAPDGKGLVFTHFRQQERPYAGVVTVDFDGSVWTTTAGPDGHHDGLQLPDGAIVFIAATQSNGVLLEDGNTADISSDHVEIAALGDSLADPPTTLFSWLDDYPHEPWHTCYHFDDDSASGGHDYTHSNSLMYDADRDAVLVLSKNLDALVSVDRATGSINWQAGGRYGDIVDVDGDDPPNDERAWDVEGPNRTWWSHGHMSHFWGTGFAMFDNGYHHRDMVSRFVEYELDQDAKTLKKVFEFRSESDVFNPLLGDVRKLSNGNYLVSWTIQGMITEITPDSEVVWRASVDIGAATGRLVYVPDVYGGVAPE